MQVPAGQFKTHCLDLLEKVRQQRLEIIVTKRGKSMAKLVPLDQPPEGSPLGYLRGRATIVGDIVASTGERWDADADER